MDAIRDWEAQGYLNLVGSFWRHVRRCLHPARWTPEAEIERLTTLAWLTADARPDYPDAPSFAAWCRLGGIEFEPDEWREILLAGTRLTDPAQLPLAG